MRVARVRRHAAVDARRRAARQNLELGRDTREVEHASVDEHLLETTCHHHADGQLDSRPGRTLARLLINPHRLETTYHHHADNLTRCTDRPDASPPGYPPGRLCLVIGYTSDPSGRGITNGGRWRGAGLGSMTCVGGGVYVGVARQHDVRWGRSLCGRG